MSSQFSDEDIKKVFDQFDMDHSGFIEAKELKDICTRLGAEVSDDKIEEIIKEADGNGDGKISFEEFKNAVV